MLTLDGIIAVDAMLDEPAAFQRLADKLAQTIRRLRRRGEVCEEDSAEVLLLFEAMYWRLFEETGRMR